MSRSWNSGKGWNGWNARVVARVSLDTVTLVRHGSFPRPRALARVEYPLRDFEEDVGPALQQGLDEIKGARLAVHLRLAHRLNRYVVLPASAALKSEEDWQAFALHRLTELFGGTGEDWTVRVSEPGRTGHRLASAVSRARLTQLNGAIAASGARLASAKPALVEALNALPARGPDARCWLACLDGPTVLFARVDHRAPRALISRHVDASSAVALLQSLRRETLLMDHNNDTPSPQTVFIHRDEALLRLPAPTPDNAASHAATLAQWLGEPREPHDGATPVAVPS